MKSKRLYLIFNGRFPSEKAASLFAAESAEAFTQAGIEVVLLVPKRKGIIKEDPFDFYRLQKKFKVVPLPIIDLFGIPVITEIFFPIALFSFSISVLGYLFFHAQRKDIVYSNESLPLFFASFRFPKTVYEMHDFPEGHLSFYQLFFKRVPKIISTNKWKKEKLISKFSVSQEKILVEFNAVNIESFAVDIKKEEARERLSLPLHKYIALYTGHLYGWKGADILAESARFLPEDVLLVFVGGTDQDVRIFKEKYEVNPKIKIVGYRPHSEIPLWQKAADVLVLPNTAKENISKYYTSPMKLFEYMASGRPIVASRLPSILEVVGEGDAIFVSPDDPEALAQGIKKVNDDTGLAERLTRASFEAVKKHTWEARAVRILSVILA